MVDDYRPTRCSGLCMLSDAQQLCGSITSHTFPHLPLALPLCFVSVCQFCSPATLPSSCLLSPRHSSFILHLFVSICLPASCLLQLLPPPAPCVSHSKPQFIYLPLFYFLTHVCVCFSFLLQWSYGFYLTHNQGQSGFEFFFKTKELKKKWLERFGMAMWVSFLWVCVFMRDSVTRVSVSLPQLHFVTASERAQCPSCSSGWATWWFMRLWRRDEQIISRTFNF